VNNKLAAWLTGMVASALSIATLSHAQTMKTEELNAKQQNIVTVAAFTASGDLPKLSEALDEGLDAGLTISEIKEVLWQMYAYAGFPRSLNGIGTLCASSKHGRRRASKTRLAKNPVRCPQTKAAWNSEPKTRPGSSVHRPPGPISPSAPGTSGNQTSRHSFSLCNTFQQPAKPLSSVLSNSVLKGSFEQ
jgi:alkylhydroperoxidase/carboxymuconolactone decarboxylase family protein YurZ